MSKNTILEVRDLCKTYIINKRQNNVLRNVNFKVNEGEMGARASQLCYIPFRAWTK